MNLAEIIYNSFTPKEAKAQESISFAPSYLTKCARAIGYKKLGFAETNPPDLPALLKMQWGDILHDDIQKRLVDAGVMESFEEAKEIDYEGMKFNYFYDGIVKINEVRAILEIKTVYASGYKSIEERPKDDHVLQALSYMIFEGIEKAVILYAGRDNGYLKQHYLEFQDVREGEAKLLVNTKDYGHWQAWKSRISRMKEIKAQLEAKELPEREFSIVMKNNGEISEDFIKDKVKYKSDWQCAYCGWKNECWKKEIQEIKKHKFFINGKFE